MKYKLMLLALCLLALMGCERDRDEGQTGSGSQEGDVAGTTSAQDGATATPRPSLPAQAGTTILVEGQLVAVRPVAAVSFSTAGRLKQIFVAAGDAVDAGDLIAVLGDITLRDNVAAASLALSQSENSLAQAQLSLSVLQEWEPDVMAEAAAEASLAAAQANLEAASSIDAAVANNLTAVGIRLQQAERFVADAQKAYETAFDPGREWELHVNELSCHPGQGGSVPCTGLPIRLKMEAERASAEAAVTSSLENLAIAQADYRLAVGSLNDDNAIQAEAAVVSAEQALAQVHSGPRESEIAAASLQVAQAELGVQQAEFNMELAQRALQETELRAPFSGSILTVEAAPETMVGAGTPIVTLLDTAQLHFHTANLSERDLAQVEPGQPVQITLKAYPSRPFEGAVLYLLPTASGTVGDAATFTAVMMIDAQELEENEVALMAGMTGRAEIRNISP